MATFPEKTHRILRSVIELYVAEGVPVSSQRVKASGGYAMSTASIRSRMAALEREGYLRKPHTSGGRIPTDEGYRFYVGHLEDNQLLWEEIGARCRSDLRDSRRDVNEIMLEASLLLGRLSKNFAVVYGSIRQESRVRQLKLVGLDGGRILVVVNLVPEYESTTVLRVGREFAADVVAATEQWVNQVIADRSLQEAKSALDALVRDNITDEGIITREVAIHREEIFSEPPATEVYFEERSHLLEQPELSDPKVLQLILRLLHDKTYLTSILSTRFSDRTQITIGAEHEDDALKPFSLITAGYRMGVARGVLGIIGPTRMRYDRALPLVNAVSRELRAIGEEFF